ncbi:MAG: DJ-1/PfpI family protein [Candidatus Acidiferrales bacterium]
MNKKMRIDILLFPGFDELDVFGPWEVLRNLQKDLPELEVILAGFYGAGEVTASHGTRILVDQKFGEGPRPDWLVVPGGGWNGRLPQGARAEFERGKIPNAIREAHEKGTAIAAVCTGAMLLAGAGLLKGRAAVTHHAAIEDLRASGARVMDARVVDDGDIVTAGGVTSGIDLALWLAERFAGKESAAKIAQLLEYERRGPIWKRAASET